MMARKIKKEGGREGKGEAKFSDIKLQRCDPMLSLFSKAVVLRKFRSRVQEDLKSEIFALK